MAKTETTSFEKHDAYQLSALSEYDANAKIHTDSQVEHIAASIKEFGFAQPIVADRNGVIIAGHGRYLAAKKLKLTHVPVWIALNLSEKQARALRLIDNTTNSETGFNQEILDLEIKALVADDFGDALELMGIDIFEDAAREQERPPTKIQATVTCPECGHEFEK